MPRFSVLVKNNAVKINFKFYYKSFLIAIFIFVVEVLIATELKNIFFVRAYLGDVFVVMLMYYFIKAFFDFNPTKLIVWIFIFSCLIEFANIFTSENYWVSKTIALSWLCLATHSAGLIFSVILRAAQWFFCLSY